MVVLLGCIIGMDIYIIIGRIFICVFWFVDNNYYTEEIK